MVETKTTPLGSRSKVKRVDVELLRRDDRYTAVSGELSREALGCPVLALGVPTVVDSAAIISGVLTALKEHWSRSALILPPDLDDEAREYTEQRLLEDFHGPLSVTPREIDDLIESMSRLLAAAIALAVHPGCDETNYGRFIK